MQASSVARETWLSERANTVHTEVFLFGRKDTFEDGNQMDKEELQHSLTSEISLWMRTGYTPKIWGRMQTTQSWERNTISFAACRKRIVHDRP